MPVAFKKLISRNPDASARMKREVECGTLLGLQNNVMPVLDASPAFDWFVMPLADGSAEKFKEELADENELRRMMIEICNALAVAHHKGWIHRDVKPGNILRINGGWALADWGLGRRPRGETTRSGRTKVGAFYGTEGFAARELGVDAHVAGPAADVFSLGQVIGWALTGQWPRPNIPLLPASPRWRPLVKGATEMDETRRIADVAEFLKRVSEIRL